MRIFLSIFNIILSTFKIMNSNDLIYENDLLHKYKPILYLHPNEEISPMSLDEYFSNSDLCVGGRVKLNQKYMWNKPEVIREDKNILIEKGNIKLPLPNRYQIIPNKYLDYNGPYNIPNRFNINNIPIYGLVFYYDNYIDLVYIFNYYYNSPYRFSFLYVGGQHQADIEHIRIRLDITGDKIFEVLGIYYSAHSSDLCSWFKSKDIEWHNNIPNRNPIIYVAKGSHANYPSPKVWYRTFGFVNDITTNKNAIIWKPEKVINLKTRNDLMSYNGIMGNEKVDNLNRDWENPPDFNCKSSFLYRFFYPISNYISYPFSICASKRK
tara:strand:- start:554 stop:1522 length:969 start_codon:yes stop_codon:yes gene_type:complete